jgi:hypothetical protein
MKREPIKQLLDEALRQSDTALALAKTRVNPMPLTERALAHLEAEVERTRRDKDAAESELERLRQISARSSLPAVAQALTEAEAAYAPVSSAYKHASSALSQARAQQAEAQKPVRVFTRIKDQLKYLRDIYIKFEGACIKKDRTRSLVEARNDADELMPRWYPILHEVRACDDEAARCKQLVEDMREVVRVADTPTNQAAYRALLSQSEAAERVRQEKRTEAKPALEASVAVSDLAKAIDALSEEMQRMRNLCDCKECRIQRVRLSYNPSA